MGMMGAIKPQLQLRAAAWKEWEQGVIDIII